MVGIPAKSNAESGMTPNGVPGRSRTPSERSDAATLASRLCRKCSASSRKILSGAQRRKMPLAEKGVRGKGRQPLSMPQLTVARSANSAPNLRALFWGLHRFLH
jgi:hypothetical protein